MRRSRAAAYDSSQASTTGMRSSAMPFCGPKVLAAPNRPVSWLSTSLAAISGDVGEAGPGRRDVDGGDALEAGRTRVQRTVGRGAEGRQQPGAAVGGARCHRARRRPPGPRRRPRPGPARRRRGSRPPRHALVGSGAVRRPGHSRRTPSPPRAARSPASARRRGRRPSRPAPRHRAPRGARRRNPDRRRPSARGRARRPGRDGASPSAIARAASTAVSVPANLSGATSTFTAAILAQRLSVPPAGR